MNIRPTTILTMLFCLSASVATSQLEGPRVYNQVEIGRFMVDAEQPALALDVQIDAIQGLRDPGVWWDFELGGYLKNTTPDRGELTLWRLAETWDGEGIPEDAERLDAVDIRPGRVRDDGTVMFSLFYSESNPDLDPTQHLLVTLDGDASVKVSAYLEVVAIGGSEDVEGLFDLQVSR